MSIGSEDKTFIKGCAGRVCEVINIAARSVQVKLENLNRSVIWPISKVEVVGVDYGVDDK